MSGILAVLEQREGKLHPMSLEALAAAQQVGTELSQPVYAVLPGNGIQPLAATLAGYQLTKVHAVEHELLKTEPAPHFLHFLDISWKSPQGRIVGLIGIVAAELIVIVHFNPCLG